MVSPTGKQSGYQAARAGAADVKRLANDRAISELLIKEHFKSKRPKPEFQDFLKQGVALEKAGRLQDACRHFEHALALQPANLELRLYISRLVYEINDASAKERQEQAYRLSLQDSGQQKKTRLLPWLDGPTHYQNVHGRKSMPPERQDSMQDLEQRAQQVRQRRERIKAEEAVLEQQMAKVERMRLKLDRSLGSPRQHSR